MPDKVLKFSRRHQLSFLSYQENTGGGNIYPPPPVGRGWRYTSIRCRRTSVIPPGATDDEHQTGRRYGGRRPGGAIKDSQLLCSWVDAWSCGSRGCLSKAWRHPGHCLSVAEMILPKKKRVLKESDSIVNMLRRRVAKMVLDKIYKSGRHSI